MSKIKLSQISTLLLFLFFFSCDPSQQLSFINETNELVTIEIVEKNNSMFSIKNNIERETPSDTTIIQLGNTGMDEEQTIYFGIGHWKVLDCIDSLILNTAKITVSKNGQEIIRYDELKEITELYESGLTGRMNERINVIVK
ncbi:MAG: hypothetical protein ACI9RM_001472 [Ulvibacter sp.]|jgi:hypothetical protein